MNLETFYKLIDRLNKINFLRSKKNHGVKKKWSLLVILMNY